MVREKKTKFFRAKKLKNLKTILLKLNNCALPICIVEARAGQNTVMPWCL
jgi:hypothetical protein